MSNSKVLVKLITGEEISLECDPYFINGTIPFKQTDGKTIHIPLIQIEKITELERIVPS